MNRYSVNQIDFEERGNEHLTYVAGDALIVNRKTKEARYTIVPAELLYGGLYINHVKKVSLFDRLKDKITTITYR